MKDDIGSVFAVYNSGLLCRQSLKYSFVARHDLLESILADLQPKNPQHRLLSGLHGMGKTTLLRRIAVAIEEEEALNNEWLALTFPEEQYNVAYLADLWLNCLYSLIEVMDQGGKKEAARQLEDKIALLPKHDASNALKLLLDEADKNQKRLLMLIDNFDLILRRLKDERRLLWEILKTESRIVVIGTSNSGIITNEADYETIAGIFKMDLLKGLSLDETIETLRKLAESNNAPHILTLIDNDPGRIKALHTLTGGNPRTIVLLYKVLKQNLQNGNILNDLDGLLDRVTPVYKTRFEEFPQQAQQLVDALALHWDPITAHHLSDLLDWPVNQVSAQLSRLEQQGVVEKQPPPTGKRVAFQLAERFFNIWYMMRYGRLRSRQKLLWLARFLRIFCHASELQSHAGQCLSKDIQRSSEAGYSMVLAHAVDDAGLRMALENQALAALLTIQDTHNKIQDLLDFDIMGYHDTELGPRLKRMMHMREIRQLFQTALAVQETDFDKQHCTELFCGSLALLKEEKDATARLSATLSSTQWEYLYAILRSEYQQHSTVFGPSIGRYYSAVAAGEIAGCNDMEGAQAAALRYGFPELLAIAAYFNFPCESWPTAVTPEVCKKAYHALLESHQSATLWNSFGTFLQLEPINFADAEYAFRQAIVLNSENAEYYNNLARLLLQRGDNLTEAVCLAERAVMLDAKNFHALYTLLALLLHTNRKTDFDMHFRRYLEEGCDDFHQSFWTNTLNLLKQALHKDKEWKQLLLTLFESGKAGQRWRPLREALMAISCDNPLYLNGIAPEIREPATNILKTLLPPVNPIS
ncbi:AAA family ATPase [Methylomicrobium sp. Wu6]|uniref:AAA family ATPase n=1 Tax=Methylomicrobium sp. Wu6 TaxID=3107928 RepID=UPI002DD6273A|nr:AAA family ATPase [Methylomicrobium sp. Wu6]MEC4748239.1 AAA family ATPase [Methylomicrobium sp. Wu6]